jgi:NitT/TauT family transport system substrate-binding protein
LREKKIGTMPKSSAAYFLDRMLRTVGLTGNDVTAVPFMAKTQAPLSLMPQALRNGDIDAVAVWEPQSQKAKLAIGADAIEFSDPSVYCELFNLCTTQARLDDPAMRQKIVAFIRALIVATGLLRHDPDEAGRLVAQAAALDIESVRHSWPYLTYPATLPMDLIEVLVNADTWVAHETGRAPRTRKELSKLIDPTVLREALAT